jgi:hypothetical protein
MMSPAQHLERYHRICQSFTERCAARTATMLAMMTCAAATCNAVVPMPKDWGWPTIDTDDAADARNTKPQEL